MDLTRPGGVGGGDLHLLGQKWAALVSDCPRPRCGRQGKMAVAASRGEWESRTGGVGSSCANWETSPPRGFSARSPTQSTHKSALRWRRLRKQCGALLSPDLFSGLCRVAPKPCLRPASLPASTPRPLGPLGCSPWSRGAALLPAPCSGRQCAPQLTSLGSSEKLLRFADSAQMRPGTFSLRRLRAHTRSSRTHMAQGFTSRVVTARGWPHRFLTTAPPHLEAPPKAPPYPN